jgi:hypothetical protein
MANNGLEEVVGQTLANGTRRLRSLVVSTGNKLSNKPNWLALSVSVTLK